MCPVCVFCPRNNDPVRMGSAAPRTRVRTVMGKPTSGASAALEGEFKVARNLWSV